MAAEQNNFLFCLPSGFTLVSRSGVHITPKVFLVTFVTLDKSNNIFTLNFPTQSLSQNYKLYTRKPIGKQIKRAINYSSAIYLPVADKLQFIMLVNYYLLF